MNLSPLERRVIELTYQNKTTHLSSCLNTVGVIDTIYKKRKKDEPFCLDNSHAALALYVVLEANGYGDAQEMVKTHGTHAGRDERHGIWVSGGSLGQVSTVAVGMALADPKRTVWLITSDGACMEGAVYEAMRVSIRYCHNLKVHVIFNGYSAYGEVKYWDLPRLPADAETYIVRQDRYPAWLRGLPGHYLQLTEPQYQELMNES